MPSSKRPFNVILPDRHHDMLSALANLQGCARGQVIRNLIAIAHHMTLEDRPHCANGTPCLVPHLHRPSAPPRSVDSQGVQAPASAPAASSSPNSQT